MGKIAFVFPGQGAQYVGMGKDLYEQDPHARQIFEMADRRRPGTSIQCFSGDQEELKQTQNTQPCLYCVDMASAYALQQAGVQPDMVAGFSLGEVAAAAFAGVLSYEEGFDLVCQRGALMQESSLQFDSAMVAVVKLPFETVEDLCRQFSYIYPVNYNCPGQLVVAGLREELAAFKDAVKQAGGKAVPLPVSGAFHTPFMGKAALGLNQRLRYAHFSTPQIPLYSNYLAEPYRDNAQELLVMQLINPVRWVETIENMIGDGADTFIEVGAGKTLSGFINKINNQVRVYNVEDYASLTRTLTEVQHSA